MGPSKPDLNPLDFLPWGYLRSRYISTIYRLLPNNMEDLKNRIKRLMRDLSEEIVKRSVYRMKKRAIKVAAEEGGVFEGKHMKI